MAFSPDNHHPVEQYNHLAGSPKRAHEGSQSQSHHAGGNAGWSQSMGKGPSSKKGSQPESKGPGGMDM
jgi:hypothetical protein